MVSYLRAMKTKLRAAEPITLIPLALLAGLLIWGSAIHRETFSIERKLPVRFDPPANLVVLSFSTDSVTVRYTGSGREMLWFQLNGIPPDATLEYQMPTGREFPAQVDLPVNMKAIEPWGDVNLEPVVPAGVRVTIDTLITRIAPVAPVFADGIPARYRFCTVEPSFVSITGPASLINSTDSVRTEAVQPGESGVYASLAPEDEMVAYSSDSVRVYVFAPCIPLLNDIFSPEEAH